MSACQGNRPGFAFQEAKSLRASLLDNRIGVASTTPFISGIRRDPGRRAGIRCEGGFAVQRICKWCGKTFEKKASDVRRGGGKYCSRACVVAARRDGGNTQQRFWSKVLRAGSDECWLWTGKPNAKGYGRFGHGGQVVQAHRFAYEITYGPLRAGMCALHNCDNPPCCNPRHLWAGTVVENNKDMWGKGRGKYQIPPGGATTQFTSQQMSGENHPFHKLTEVKFRELRQLRCDGLTLQALADRFGISLPVAAKTAKGELWRCVPA